MTPKHKSNFYSVRLVLFFLIGYLAVAAPVKAQQDDSLLFSGLLGGSGNDRVYAIVTDSQGGFYLAGETTSPDLPVSENALDRQISQREGFIARFDSTWEMLWLTYLGGSGQDSVYDLALGDSAIYAVGETTSSDFPGAPPVAGSQDAFAVALSLDGTSLYYSTLIGGSDLESAYALVVEDNTATLTGITYSLDLVPNTYMGEGDVFVARLNPSGSLIYTRLLGGRSVDAGFDIAVQDGDAWVVGQTYSFNFPGMGLQGLQDGFVVRLDSSGGIRWSKLLGGSGEDNIQGVDVDEDGRAYVSGVSGSGDFPSGSSLYGPTDAFLARLSAEGDVQQAIRLGGSRDELGRNVALTANGQVLMCGMTLSSDFPTTNNALQSTLKGLSDAFVASFDAETLGSPNRFYATLIGGSGEDACNGLVSPSSGLALISGETNTADLPATLTIIGGGGNGDGFFALLAAVAPAGPTPVPTATPLTATPTEIEILTPTIPLVFTPPPATPTPLAMATSTPSSGRTPVFLPQIGSGASATATGPAAPVKGTLTPLQPDTPTVTPTDNTPLPDQEFPAGILVAAGVVLIVGILGGIYWFKSRK